MNMGSDILFLNSILSFTKCVFVYNEPRYLSCLLRAKCVKSDNLHDFLNVPDEFFKKGCVMMA